MEQHPLIRNLVDALVHRMASHFGMDENQCRAEIEADARQAVGPEARSVLAYCDDVECGKNSFFNHPTYLRNSEFSDSMNSAIGQAIEKFEEGETGAVEISKTPVGFVASKMNTVCPVSVTGFAQDEQTAFVLCVIRSATVTIIVHTMVAQAAQRLTEKFGIESKTVH